MRFYNTLLSEFANDVKSNIGNILLMITVSALLYTAIISMICTVEIAVIILFTLEPGLIVTHILAISTAGAIPTWFVTGYSHQLVTRTRHKIKEQNYDLLNMVRSD